MSIYEKTSRLPHSPRRVWSRLLKLNDRTSTSGDSSDVDRERTGSSYSKNSNLDSHSKNSNSFDQEQVQRS